MYQEKYSSPTGGATRTSQTDVFVSGNRSVGRRSESDAALEAEAVYISTKALKRANNISEVIQNLSRDTGTDLSGVPIHTRELDEPGYTANGEVHLDSSLELSGEQGRAVLGHELVHAAQQGAAPASSGGMQVSAAPTGMVQHFPLKKKWAYRNDAEYQNIRALAEVYDPNNLDTSSHVRNDLRRQAKAYLDAAQDPKHPHTGRRAEVTRLMESLNRAEGQAMINDIMGQRQDPLGGPIGGSAPADLSHVDPNMGYKNARAMRDVAADFPGINLSAFEVVDPANQILAPNEHPFAATSEADASLSGKMRISKNTRKDYAANRLRFSPGGTNAWLTASSHYTAAHEMGHLATYDVRNKIFQDEAVRTGVNKDDERSWDAWSGGIPDAIMYDAAIEALSDDEFKTAIMRELGFDPQTTDIYDMPFQDAFREHLSPQLLSNAGYTSQYGATNSDEVIAEAFAEHYRLKEKQRKYTGNAAKLTEAKYKENPYAEAVVALMKDLHAGDAAGVNKRQTFYNRHQTDIAGRANALLEQQDATGQVTGYLPDPNYERLTY